MRIACVDKRSSDRLALKEHVEGAIAHERDTIGHLAFLSPTPLSIEELLLSTSPPEIIILGSALSVNESLEYSRQIKSRFNESIIFSFIRQEEYSLRNLSKLTEFCHDVFCAEESSTRFVLSLTRVMTQSPKKKDSLLVVVHGAKGGIGATSIVSGLAHATTAIGKKAVVLDLAPMAPLVKYMSPSKTRSADFAELLTGDLYPSLEIARKCITCAPNGIEILLPPAGEQNIRELWIRDKTKFETTLQLIEAIRQDYDLILVDSGKAEGILPFALMTKADFNLLLSSNESASIHLLNLFLSEIALLPGDNRIRILLNLLKDDGFSKSEVVDFLYINEKFHESLLLEQHLNFDKKAKDWIGTGNSFYTEGSSKAKTILEQIVSALFNNKQQFTKTQRTWPKYSFSPSAFLRKAKLLLLPPPSKNNEEKQKGRIKLGNSLIETPRITFNGDITKTEESLLKYQSLLDNFDGFLTEPKLLSEEELESSSK